MALASSGPQDPPTPGLPPLEAWPVLARDRMTTTREFYESVTNALTGEVAPVAHRVIQVGSGLNFQDEQGFWKESEDRLEISDKGQAVGLCAPHKLPFLLRSDIPSNCMGRNVPLIVSNQDKRAYPRDAWWALLREDTTVLGNNYNGWNLAVQYSTWLDGPWNGDPVGGDGGHPLWVLINNELVLAGHWTFSTAGAFYGFNIGRINAAIAELAQEVNRPADVVTPADLGSFPDL